MINPELQGRHLDSFDVRAMLLAVRTTVAKSVVDFP
jgi:hypothetical protein